MKYAIWRNEDLGEPYCYEHLDENGNWVGVGDYNPEKEIPGFVACDERGCVYTFDPETGMLGEDPLDCDQEFEDWVDGALLILEKNEE